ncbi:DNA (cytosine-5-)-methyltransferase [Escherichia coli]|uniref:DNA cytosine methyltransferase n=1 Tax=Escherichia coli TaxID=562 RepID=UPI0012DC2F0C|nr:DNA (cytosine-5-)-methyltransferase [Escherichia coli]MUM95585.1 DNA (cytosine-5-)-methyltransferase [Escherichia coli]
MKFIEFFSGVGLVREGLSASGWVCAFANDISHEKMLTYISNYGEDNFYLGDIWDLVKNEMIIPNDAFLYTASFPCTDLSVAGNRAGLEGKESGTLLAIIEILKKKEIKKSAPKVILLENVPGFITSKNGSDLLRTINELNSLDYYIDVIEIDASLFTPQSRPRVFIIAMKSDVAIKNMVIKNDDDVFCEWFNIIKNTELKSTKLKSLLLNNNLKLGSFNLNAPRKTELRLRDIIDTDIKHNSKLWWNDERKQKLYTQMSEKHKSVLHQMIHSPEYSYGTVYRRMRNAQSTAELRTDGIAGCLRTPKGGSSKQILIQAGMGHWMVRLLSPREYARLQGVRDSFILPENDNKGYFAMGDAVCVPVIEFIAKNIITPAYKRYFGYLKQAV